MHYCSYHPVQPASYECANCYRQQCDACVDEQQRCFLCTRPTEHLGASHRVEPFWRRLQAGFRYPLNPQSLTLIIGVAVVTAVLVFLPSLAILTWVISLVTSGFIMKYSFRCLEDTARGQMSAPDVNEAYQGGIGLLFQLLLMLIVLAVAVAGIGHVFGPGWAAAAGFFCIVGLPAMLISFALSESLIAAVNPLNTFRLMTRIGLPYGLLLGLILVMMGSVSVINQFIGTHFAVLSTLLQSAASNYYLIVVFHIMGYVIFQYQDKLGFTAHEDDGEVHGQRTERQLRDARLAVYLKEGRYDQVYRLLDDIIAREPDDKHAHAHYFEMVHQLRDARQMDRLATRYLKYAQRQGYGERLYDIFRQIREVAPQCLPDDAELRLLLAREAEARGEYVTAVALINGMHKQYPGSGQLVEAFELMAQALSRLPDREREATLCRQLAQKLAQRKPLEKTQPATKTESAKIAPERPTTVEPLLADEDLSIEASSRDRWQPIEFD